MSKEDAVLKKLYEGKHPIVYAMKCRHGFEKEEVLRIAKEVAIGFLEWAISEGWQHYDGHDRWINLENGRTVLETKQLYQQYLNHLNEIQKTSQ